MIYPYTFNWTRKFLINDYVSLFKHLETVKPKWVVLDTETTGLHLKASQPFLIIVAFVNERTKQGFSYALDWNTFNVSKLIFESLKECTYLVGWNIKYDLHMMNNAGVNIDAKQWINLDKPLFADCQILKRLLTNADTKEVNFSMKPSAEEIFGATATLSEKALTDLKTKLRTTNTRLLNTALKPFGLTYSNVKKKIENNEVLPNEVVNIYNQYIKDQDINYQTLYQKEPKLMLDYALNDGVINCELFHTYYNQLITLYKSDLSIWVNECKSLLVFYELEKNGMSVDRNYLTNAINTTKEAIKDIRDTVFNITNLEPTQTKELTTWFANSLSDKKLMTNAYGKISIDKSTLKKVINSNELDSLKIVAKAIITHRELNKDIGTYYQNLLEMSEYDNKVYYQTQVFGTVTGRVSGAFQQFPREPTIYKDKELGFIRKAFVPSINENYSSVAYFDFSQMELRVTAHYSIVNNSPDANLLRAYIPYGCYHYQTKAPFDYNNKSCLKTWDLKQLNGHSAWLDNQTNLPWEPTDLHTLTAEHAFGKAIYNLPESEFKKFRSAAKTTNFCLNYGGGIYALQRHELLKDLSKEQIAGLFNGFHSAYKGAITFSNGVKSFINKHYSIKNMFGRVYQISDTSQNYKAPNWMVQGACADYMKYLGILLLKFLNSKNYKSRIISQVHDEWQVEISNADPPIVVKEIQTLLTNEGYNWFKVPLTCDAEITYTNWASKKGI